MLSCLCYARAVKQSKETTEISSCQNSEVHSWISQKEAQVYADMRLVS